MSEVYNIIDKKKLDIVNKPINLSSVKDLKNYDAFFYACEASFN